MSLFFAVIFGDLAVVRVTADIFIAIPLSEHATDSSAVERYMYNIATSDPRPLLVAFRSNGLTFSARLITAQEHLPALTPYITDMDYVSHVVDIEDAEGYKAQITFIIFCSVCGMIVGGCGALLLKRLEHAFTLHPAMYPLPMHHASQPRTSLIVAATFMPLDRPYHPSQATGSSWSHSKK
ncbi:hypothetical protein BDZ89DRAFT_1045767 [Hymenopellis radicata]|nr:hypothetical protein BDZ89DRAFT_1045767 [Hymenopellis radicata]